MPNNRLVACVIAHGDPNYRSAAVGAALAILEHTDWELVLVSDAPIPAVVADDPRVSGLRFEPPPVGDRAVRFLAKFDALERALAISDAPLVALLDADTRIVRRTTADDVADALGGLSMGMVEQTGIRGSGMDRSRFREHYRDVSLAFIDSTAPVPALEDFRFFNSGVMFGRREAIVDLVRTTRARIERRTDAHVVGEHMVTDQDYFQHWANTLYPGACAELSWEWNHCEWWDDDFPAAGARILHFSNFCLGPTREALERMDETAALLADPEGSLVSAVVVTHRSAACIAACVRALRLSGVSHIVVVDNASSDESADIAERLGCDVVRLPRNHGFAVAANAGARLCRTPTIAFVNPDCIVDVATVRRGAKLCAASTPTCAVPDFLDVDGTITRGVQGGYTPRILIAAVRASRTGKPVSARSKSWEDSAWNWPLGACLFVGRRAFRATGGFDEAYFLYMEDVDFGRRWCERGGLVLSTETIVEHAAQTGSDVPSVDRVRQLNRARLRFARERFGPLTAWRVQRATGGHL